MSGPIRKGNRAENIRRGIEVGKQLMALGFAPFVPHAVSGDGGFMNDEKFDDVIQVDLAFVAASDAVLRLDGESQGADMETAFAVSLGIPIFESIEELQADSPYTGDLSFEREALAMLRLYGRKQRDYGRDDDPYANVKAAEDFGIAPWIGTLVRMNDKIRRLQKFAKTGRLVNEGALDSFDDIAVYALIGKVLLKGEGVV